jgi:hypothetical protein
VSDFVHQNKDILTFCVPLFGMLLSLCFGGILNWRHKICIDYEGRRDVAINILQDKYVQLTSTHHSEVIAQSENEGIEVIEIYNRKEQRQIIRDLAAILDDINRIKRYFNWLDWSSLVAFRSLLLAIPLSALPLLSIWIRIPSGLVWTWAVFLVMSLSVFVLSISSLSIVDGRFFRLVNRIIDPDQGV